MSDGYGEYEGVGGWLAFFLVTLGIISPALMIFTTWRDLSDPLLPLAYGDSFGSIQLVAWGITIVTALLCWFVVYRLLRVLKWRSVVIAIVSLWVIALTNTFIGAWAISTVAGLPLADFLKELNVELVRPFIYAGVWTAYLLISRRVANTYRGRYPEEEEQPYPA